MKRYLSTIQLLDEAAALERIGGTWSQKHAAAFLSMHVATLRRSDCPKHHEESNGPTGKPLVVYVPAEVRAWKVGRRHTQAA